MWSILRPFVGQEFKPSQDHIMFVWAVVDTGSAQKTYLRGNKQNTMPVWLQG